MRIAFSVPESGFLEPEIGGDHVLARGLLEGLIARRHAVEVVSRLDPSDFDRGRVSALAVARETAKVHRRMKRFSPDAWLVYSPSQGRPDLFGWWQRPQRYMLFAAHAPHELSSRAWRSSLLASAHRRALASADAVSAWRPAGIDKLRAYGIPEKRLCLLLPAAQSWRSMPSRDEARRRLDLPQKAPVVLCAGRFSTDKRGRAKKTQMMLDLIHAMARLPSDVVLVIVGEGPGRALLERKAAEVAPDRVRIVGPAEHSEMNVFYAGCDLYAYPTQKDYTFVSVLEAQCCGRPVVTMHTRSAELSVQNGRTGLLAKDLPEFEAHVAELAADRTRCESMGRAAREYVEGAHTIDIRVRQIETLLSGAASASPSQTEAPSPRSRDLLGADSS